MKIIVTGSTGNVSKPLTKLLIDQGHTVTVISSDPKKQSTIESMHATAAIGSIEDPTFLAKTFENADAAYCMIPMPFTGADPQTYLAKMAANYTQAIKQAAVPRVVAMSGWAADLLPGENAEDVFTSELKNTSITILRPASFYTNFYQSITLIRGKGLLGKFLTLRYAGLNALLTGKTGLLMGNLGGNDRTVFVSPIDIADAIAEELVIRPDHTTFRYVGSEEMTCNEAATIIGTAIGKPWLKWIRISDKQMLQGLKMAKLPQKLAELLVAMQVVMHNGKPLENFHRNDPKLGKIKLAEFAKEFAAVYNQK
jgi:NAD(P)H dehydrogenase (quinone)